MGAGLMLHDREVRVVGLDSPGTRTGFAMVASGPAGDRLVRSGTSSAETCDEIEAASAQFEAMAPDLVVLEGAARPDSLGAGHARLTIALATRIGRWQQALERRGLPTSVPLASTWQSAVLGNLITSTSRQEARRSAARAWVRRTFGVELSDTETAAACIAVWGVRRLRATMPNVRRAS